MSAQRKPKSHPEHVLTLEIRVWGGASPDDAADGLQHAAGMAAKGYTSGEICTGEGPGRGWWTLQSS